MGCETYQARDMSAVALWLDEREWVKQGCHSRRTSLLGTWDSAGLGRGEWGQMTVNKDIREAGGASDASQESTDEERVKGEVEETAEHGVMVQGV